MDPYTSQFVVFIAVEVAVGMGCLLHWSERHGRKKLWRLGQAADLLRQHADNLEAFLSDAAAPADLKDMLVVASEAFADEAIAKTLAATWIARRQARQPPDADAEALGRVFAELQAHQPHLARLFIGALGSAIAASAYRWTRGTTALEALLARVAVDPEADLAAATIGAHLRGGIRFGMRPDGALRMAAASAAG